jgi:hypothetical protein
VSSTLTINLSGGGTMTVTPFQTGTPGLLHHDVPFFDEAVRLIHHTGLLLGKFDEQEQAIQAATAMADLADWSAGPEALRAGGRELIWRTIDAIESAGGSFTATPGGAGEQVAMCRWHGCTPPWETGDAHAC